MGDVWLRGDRGENGGRVVGGSSAGRRSGKAQPPDAVNGAARASPSRAPVCEAHCVLFLLLLLSLLIVSLRVGCALGCRVRGDTTSPLANASLARRRCRGPRCTRRSGPRRGERVSRRVIAGNRVGSPVGRRTAGPHVRMSHPQTRLVEGYPSLVLLSGLLYCFDVFFSLQSLTCKARIAAAAKTYHQVCGVILGRAACQCRCCCVQG